MRWSLIDYSLPYGHHGLIPCSTHLGEGGVNYELSPPGIKNVPNAEGRNAFPERSERAVLIHPSLCMTVTSAGGEKILAILPLKCAIFSEFQAFSGYATCSLPQIGRLEDLVKMTHTK